MGGGDVMVLGANSFVSAQEIHSLRSWSNTLTANNVFLMASATCGVLHRSPTCNSVGLLFVPRNSQTFANFATKVSAGASTFSTK